MFRKHCGKASRPTAQLINCLNRLYLAHEDKLCVTPVGHVSAMYADHQNEQSQRIIFSAPDVTYDRDGKPARFWGLRGLASLHDKQLVLTAVNQDVSAARLEAQRTGPKVITVYLALSVTVVVVGGKIVDISALNPQDGDVPFEIVITSGDDPDGRINCCHFLNVAI